MDAASLQAAPLLDCFSGQEASLFPEHLCCDAEQWPPSGWWKCWGGDFTYENCCGALPSCSEELVSEVWKFVDPNAERTYREFWLSNAFYKISRVRKELMCKIPFVASRVLAFTNLDWIEQWEVLNFPRQCVHNHTNFQLGSIVDAMWSIFEELPLEDFLKSGKWAEMILKRLYGHSKKTAYYLLSDGMSLLPGRLPLSDASMTPEDEEFQRLLRRRLNLKLPLPLAEAQQYLQRPQAAVFGRVAAHLVLATLQVAAPRREAMGAAQELLRSWVGKNDYADLFFSHWPIYRLMLYLHRRLDADAASVAAADAWEEAEEVLVISCLPEMGALPKGWRRTQGCRGPWSQLLDGRKTRWVLLISSGANWTASDAGSVREALALAEEVPVSMAVGFPTTDRNGLWTWPVRRLDVDPLDSGASVRYTSYPTGYAGSQGRCCRGDTTSGTRAYHWDTLRALFQEVERWDSVKTMPQLLQRLDFLQRDRLGSGRAAATCMVPPLVEDDYVGPLHLVPRSELPKDWHPKIEELGYRQRSPMTIRWEPSDELVDGTPKVMVLYCGPLDLKPQMQKFRFLGSVFQESLENCAHRLRSAANRLSAPDQWILFVSPFAVDAAAVDLGFVQALRTALLRRHPEGPEAMAAGSAARGEDGRPAWTARSIKYRFYKVQYRYLAHGTLQGPLTPEDGTCLLGDASSGTRLYRPGVLQALLKKTVALDVATLMVELDLLAKLGGSPPGPRLRRRRDRDRDLGGEMISGRILTCAGPNFFQLREEDYLQKANLPDAFAQRYQVEAVDYAGRILTSSKPALLVGNGTDWQTAHTVAEQRIATSLLYRRRIEDDFVKIVKWWTSLDPEHHFAAPKQGTLLTAMVRGGDVSMMPWDTDLELALYSTGANPVLGWCDDVLDLQDRRSCVLRQLQEQLQMPIKRGPDQFFSQWLYETHLTFAKYRVNVDMVFDVNFERYVPLFPIKVRMFGDSILRVSWPVWEHLFFEVFQGNFEKKVGTSGNIAASVPRCRLEHNACIPDCEQPEGPCDFEFQDYFAHSRDPKGHLFPD